MLYPEFALSPQAQRFDRGSDYLAWLHTAPEPLPFDWTGYLIRRHWAQWAP